MWRWLCNMGLERMQEYFKGDLGLREEVTTIGCSGGWRVKGTVGKWRGHCKVCKGSVSRHFLCCVFANNVHLLMNVAHECCASPASKLHNSG